jgi:hypothetical protein
MEGSLQSAIIATVSGLAAQIEREFISVRTKEVLATRKAERVNESPIRTREVAIIPCKVWSAQFERSCWNKVNPNNALFRSATSKILPAGKHIVNTTLEWNPFPDTDRSQ